MNISDLFNPYSYAMQLRRALYKKGTARSERVSVPVISIGNLSMGGTGKTPVTLALAKYCIETLHKKTAVVLRGYKRKSTGYLLVSDGQKILQNVSQSGDEAQIYAVELLQAIVICDEEKTDGARNAIALGAEVILLDDGFQHLSLQRDLNILLINSDEGIPAVFPFGKGREGYSAASDADIIIYTNSENKNIAAGTQGKPVVTARTVLKSVSLYPSNEITGSLPQFFSGKRILVLSGIANPGRFEKSVAEYSASTIPYPLKDHAEYDRAVLEKIISKAKAERCDAIAATTKDAVKILGLYQEMQKKDASAPPLMICHAEIEFISGREILFTKINDLFKS